MTMTEPWDVREPATVLGEVLRHGRPQPGDVLVALLGRAGDADQEVVGVVRVHRGGRPRRRDASEMLRKHAEGLAGPRPWVDGCWMPPAHVLVTVVCRSGRAGCMDRRAGFTPALDRRPMYLSVQGRGA